MGLMIALAQEKMAGEPADASTARSETMMTSLTGSNYTPSHVPILNRVVPAAAPQVQVQADQIARFNPQTGEQIC